MIVSDASFSGAWLLPDEGSAEAEKILKQVINGKEELALPDLWNYEITNLLLSATRRGRISEEQIEEGLHLLQSVPAVFYDHRSLLARNRIARLSVRYGLSAYDGAYLELADRLQCRLYSQDRQLQKAAQSLGLR